MQEVTIYTDGAARGNPGRGGYGVILMSGNRTKELSQGYRLTTNNRMELMGVIAALEAMKKKGLNITIYSDSQYIVKAIKEGWLNKWLATNFALSSPVAPWRNLAMINTMSCSVPISWS